MLALPSPKLSVGEGQAGRQIAAVTSEGLAVSFAWEGILASVRNESALQLTPELLKARFKQLQQQTNNVYQNWQIRVHRSLSWYRRAAEIPAEQPETRFILLWISLNCLYSRWDAAQNAPGKDTAARDEFLARICRMDPVLIEALLRRYRPLLRKLLEDPFLSNTFWRDPFDARSKGRAAEDANHLESNLKSGDYRRLLGQVMSRLYVLRGQLVHGASTGGGRLNRKPLSYGLQLLVEIVPLIIHVVLEHGCSDDWPELCYPPIK